MAFNENTRVKIPAILHLCRLGFNYLSIFTAKRDETTNIFTDLFSECIKRINRDRDLEDGEIKRLLENISLSLDNEDLGRSFLQNAHRQFGYKTDRLQRF